MKPGRLTGCGTVTSGWVALALVIVAAPVLVWPELSAAEEIISGEVIIEATALRPQVLMTEPEHRVTFVNRSGRMVHLDFILHDPELHHVFQVPDQIWAIFHRIGRHPYEVHFSDRALPDLHGAIEVVGDPYGGPDPRVCGGITVQGACIER
jgi:hypothetical protein